MTCFVSIEFYCTTYKLKWNIVCLNLIFIRSEDQRVDDQVCKCEQACGSDSWSVGSGLCRAERQRFETQPTLNILSVPIILKCIVCSNESVKSLIIILNWRLVILFSLQTFVIWHKNLPLVARGILIDVSLIWLVCSKFWKVLIKIHTHTCIWVNRQLPLKRISKFISYFNFTMAFVLTVFIMLSVLILKLYNEHR